MLRFSLFLCFFSFSFANAMAVLVAKEPIMYEEKLNPSKLKLINVSSIKKACIPLTLAQLQNNEYKTTHYINRNSIICQKDVETYKDEAVLFNFGSIQIEKKGKIIYENDKFIRIKKADGSVEKIYKDGRLK